jgi:hypothetical protein
MAGARSEVDGGGAGLSGHSGAMRSIEPGISRFPDAQLRICGLVLRTIPE